MGKFEVGKGSGSKCPQCSVTNVSKGKKHFKDQASNSVLLLVQTRVCLDPCVGVDRVTQKYITGGIKI
jgi:hypothetical protein